MGLNFECKPILELIIALSNRLFVAIQAHGRSEILTGRVLRLCPPGKEFPLFQLCLVNDCLSAIESVLFSLNGSMHSNSQELFIFLRAAAKLLAKKDKSIYSRFEGLTVQDSELFLETHYTDRRPFGGADRKSLWSGFLIARKIDEIVGNLDCCKSYRMMFQQVVFPLLSEDATVDDVIELGGIWAHISKSTKPKTLNGVAQNKTEGNLQGFDKFLKFDFCNSAILFDVYSAADGTPAIKLNSSHTAFSSNRAIEILLKAWAVMESSAWDPRKQILEDIRSDWGRVARDFHVGEQNVELK